MRPIDGHRQFSSRYIWQTKCNCTAKWKICVEILWTIHSGKRNAQSICIQFIRVRLSRIIKMVYYLSFGPLLLSKYQKFLSILFYSQWEPTAILHSLCCNIVPIYLVRCCVFFTVIYKHYTINSPHLVNTKIFPRNFIISLKHSYLFYNIMVTSIRTCRSQNYQRQVRNASLLVRRVTKLIVNLFFIYRVPTTYFWKQCIRCKAVNRLRMCWAEPFYITTSNLLYN